MDSAILALVVFSVFFLDLLLSGEYRVACYRFFCVPSNVAGHAGNAASVTWLATPETRRCTAQTATFFDSGCIGACGVGVWPSAEDLSAVLEVGSGLVCSMDAGNLNCWFSFAELHIHSRKQ